MSQPPRLTVVGGAANDTPAPAKPTGKRCSNCHWLQQLKQLGGMTNACTVNPPSMIVLPGGFEPNVDPRVPPAMKMNILAMAPVIDQPDTYVCRWHQERQ